MKLRPLAIAVAVLGLAAFLASGLEYELPGFPSLVSEAAWPVFLLAVLTEVGLGIAALVRRARDGRVAAPSR